MVLWCTRRGACPTIDKMTKKIKIGSIEINYYQTGQGQPLVLLHGWSNNWQGWEQIINCLKKDFKVYALDFPGYGDSSDLPRYSLKIEADYVAKFIRRLNLKPVVVGTSFGSAVGAVLARSYPTLASKVILISAPITGNHPAIPFFSRLYSFILNRPFFHPAFVAVIKSKAFSYTTAKLLNMYRFDKKIIDRYGFAGRRHVRARALLETGISTFEARLEKVIPSLSPPSLLIWGENDKLVNRKLIRKMTDKLDKKKFTTVFIPQCGHVVHFEKPKVASQIITSYLKAE